MKKPSMEVDGFLHATAGNARLINKHCNLFRRQRATLTAHHAALARHHVARRGPAVALKRANQVPHRSRMLGGAARPDKSCFNPAIIDYGSIHGVYLVTGLDAKSGLALKICLEAAARRLLNLLGATRISVTTGIVPGSVLILFVVIMAAPAVSMQMTCQNMNLAPARMPSRGKARAK